MKKMFGYSLMELLLAITVTLIFLSYFLGLFLSSFHHYRYQLALHTLQENGRIISHVVMQDIRLAGYIGCAQWTESFPFTNHTETEFDFKHRFVIHSDSISVAHASIKHTTLIQPMTENNILYTTSDISFRPGNILIISNCKSAEVFQVSARYMNKQGIQRITTSAPLSQLYSGYYEVALLEKNTYFIEKKSMYVSDIYNHKVGLIDGASALEIKADGELDQNRIEGVSLSVVLSALEESALKKTFYFYTALREGNQ